MSDTLPTTTTGDSLVNRMIRAARLDVSLYEEVEADRNATSQAAIVVGIVALASAIGGALAIAIVGAGGNLIAAVLGGVVSAFLGWVLWGYLTYFIGTSMFGGTATPGEMLRTIGFAQSPGVLAILIFIPIVGWLLGIVLAIWQIVAGVIAVRQALDFETSKAVITTLLAAIPFLIVRFLVNMLIGV